MENLKKSGLEKPVKDELNTEDLMAVEGGADIDSDEDCLYQTCASKAQVTCYSNA